MWPSSADWAGFLQRHWWRAKPSWLARALQPLSAVYALLAAGHRWLYAAGWLRSQHPGVPVIVVGNLIVGGAGKTPTVIALVQALREAGWTPGVISRGHGRRGNGVVEVQRSMPAADTGDEPLLIHLRTGAPVVVASDRVRAAQALRRQHPHVDLLIADDGLQHHRLARDAQLIVFDDRGIGNGLRLPAGPLREAVPAALPAHTLVLYNAAAPSTPLPGWPVDRRLAGAVALADWWRGALPQTHTLTALRGRPVLAAAGIAEPQRFFTMLQAAGLTMLPLPLPDHHDFSTLPWPPSTPDVVVTEKDAIKLGPGRVAGTRVWVVALDFAFAAGLMPALLQWLPPPAAPSAPVPR